MTNRLFFRFALLAILGVSFHSLANARTFIGRVKSLYHTQYKIPQKNNARYRAIHNDVQRIAYAHPRLKRAYDKNTRVIDARKSHRKTMLVNGTTTAALTAISAVAGIGPVTQISGSLSAASFISARESHQKLRRLNRQSDLRVLKKLANSPKLLSQHGATLSHDSLRVIKVNAWMKRKKALNRAHTSKQIDVINQRYQNTYSILNSLATSMNN